MMSLCQFRMVFNDEAARMVDGSDTDGYADKALGLPFTVVGLHVNLLAFDHSEMASYAASGRRASIPKLQV